MASSASCSGPSEWRRWPSDHSASSTSIDEPMPLSSCAAWSTASIVRPESSTAASLAAVRARRRSGTRDSSGWRSPSRSPSSSAQARTSARTASLNGTSDSTFSAPWVAPSVVSGTQNSETTPGIASR